MEAAGFRRPILLSVAPGGGADLVPDAVLVELERVETILSEIVADNKIQQEILQTPAIASAARANRRFTPALLTKRFRCRGAGFEGVRRRRARQVCMQPTPVCMQRPPELRGTSCWTARPAPQTNGPFMHPAPREGVLPFHGEGEARVAQRPSPLKS